MLNKRILGIDPGYGRMGIAILEKRSPNNGGKEILLYSECFETSEKLPHPERLALLAKKLNEIFEEWKPNKLAIETLLFSKNVKTALKVAESRGVILSEAAKRKIDIFEFNPNSIKLAVTGYGKADKKQMIDMLQIIFQINKQKNKNGKEEKKYDDEYDAIAVALTASVSILSTTI